MWMGIHTFICACTFEAMNWNSQVCSSWLPVHNRGCQVHPSMCQCVCWQCQVHLAGSCVEWDYVNLSLVEVLSPTPAHNCQERQTNRERGKEGEKELWKWVGERWNFDKHFGKRKNRMSSREMAWWKNKREARGWWREEEMEWDEWNWEFWRRESNTNEWWGWIRWLKTAWECKEQR